MTQLLAGQRFEIDSLPFRGFYGFRSRMASAPADIPSGGRIQIDDWTDDENDPDEWLNRTDGTGELTIGQSCYAIITLQIRFSNSAVIGQRGAEIMLGGSRVAIEYQNAADGNVTILPIVYQSLLEPGDEITFNGMQASGSPLAMQINNNDTWMSLAAFLL